MSVCCSLPVVSNTSLGGISIFASFSKPCASSINAISRVFSKIFCAFYLGRYFFLLLLNTSLVGVSCATSFFDGLSCFSFFRSIVTTSLSTNFHPLIDIFPLLGLPFTQDYRIQRAIICILFAQINILRLICNE